MSETFKNKTLRALFWSAVERFGHQGVRALITLVLARLLTPEDFGVVGIMTALILIAEAIINDGFGQAIVQRKEVTENDLTTAFVLSVGTAAFLYFIVFASAGPIAAFYGQPKLKSLSRVLSLVVVFDSLIVIQLVQFQRALDFRTVSIVSLVSALIGGGIGIGLALLDFGVWSLVAQMVSHKATMAFYYWIQSNWKPSGTFSRESFRHIFGYGWKLQVAGILSQLFRNLYSLIIGKAFSVAVVGYYIQAKNLKDLPVVSMSTIVGKVTFPAFSSLQDDRDRMKQGYRRSIILLSFVAFPLMLCMGAAADRLIPFLLGDQWAPSVKFFQLMCLVGMVYPIQALNVNVLKVTARTDLFLILEVIKKAVTLAIIVITIRWGVYALVLGQVVSSSIALILNASFSGRQIDYGLKEQVQDWAPYLLTALVACGVVYGCGRLLSGASDLIALAIQVVAGVVSYLLLCLLLKLEAIHELRRLIPTTGQQGETTQN